VGIICAGLTIYWFILLASVIASWFMMASRRPPIGPARTAIDALNAVTQPVFRPVRSLLPPIRAGGMGLDLSPLIVFIVLGIVRQALC
jgi:YggT family protein